MQSGEIKQKDFTKEFERTWNANTEKETWKEKGKRKFFTHVPGVNFSLNPPKTLKNLIDKKNIKSNIDYSNIDY